MKAGIALAKQLRQMTIPETHTREVRALFVAQALAYQCPLSLEKPSEQIVAECRESMLDVVNDVNEMVAVDTKLTMALFEKMVHSRMEILTSVADVTLLDAALCSKSLMSRFNPDMLSTLTSFVSQPDFANGHRAVRDIMDAHFTAKETQAGE